MAWKPTCERHTVGETGEPDMGYTPPDPENVLKKMDPTLTRYLGSGHKTEWQRRTELTDEELVYYLWTPKLVRSRIRWEVVEGPSSKSARLRFNVPVHCKDGAGDLTRLIGIVATRGYSVSLVYPAKPKGIRLLGLDSKPTKDAQAGAVPGPHIQLWSQRDAACAQGHTRVAHCDDEYLSDPVAGANHALQYVVKSANIETRYPVQFRLEELWEG